MTTEEYRQITIEVLNQYFDPIFKLIGAGIAVLVIALAIILVIKPFIRKI